MNEITWKYVKPLKKENLIEEFEKQNKITFPLDLKNCLKENNGGRPSLKYYDTNEEKDKEVKTLLSFNEDDIETIYKYFPLDSKNKNLIPFANDPAGNFFVIENEKIGFWNHETDKVKILASTFTAFLTMLHD